MSATPLPPPGFAPGALVPDPLAAALRAIRLGAAALEAGRPGDARDALGEAARVLVFLHTQVDEPDGGDEIARTLRWVAFRLKDADLLRDVRAARAAEHALALLASGLRRRGAPGGRA